MSLFVLFDYGVGNMHSLAKGLVKAGASVQVTRSTRALVDADVAVLPGVGAFGHVMGSLADAADGLRERHAQGRPILGVCIGMQALYEGSAETPDVPGLGILAGTVKRLGSDAGKVPHMGWNRLHTDDPLFDGLDGAYVYYVHSYAAAPSPASVATTQYGVRFSAAARQDNTLAFQFHPEKSSTVGQQILRRSVAFAEACL